MLLYGDSIRGFNSRTKDAFDSNATYTEARGECVGSNAPYQGIADDTDHVDMTGINVSKVIFKEGCGIIYAGEPAYEDSLRNITWIPSGQITLNIGAGCSSRLVNGTWDNGDANRPSGGLHREYLLPVQEEVTVSVNGEVCLNTTQLLGLDAYPKSVHSVRMMRVNCSVNGSRAAVTLSHTCRGFVLLDSAYSVMGWKRTCRRDYYVQKVCIPNCESANIACLSRKNGCEHVDCASRCSQIADRICVEKTSGQVSCPRPPSGTFGNPEDGSSRYFIEIPKDSPNDPCMCRHSWDPSNTCINNRVSLAAANAYTCRDHAEYLVDLKAAISCEGTYYEDGPYIRANMSLVVKPDISSAFIIGDVLHRFSLLVPFHKMYRIFNASGPEVKTYRLTDGDYGINQSHNDTGFFDFASMEAVYNPMPPRVGKGIILESQSLGNGSYGIKFTYLGPRDGLEGLTITVLGVKDRINSLEQPPCNPASACPSGQYCLDERCLDTTGLKEQTVRVMECIRRVDKVTQIGFFLSDREVSFEFRPWLAIFGVLLLFAVGFNLAQGKRGINDVYSTLRGFLR
jgi:hypothetical protein